jgi:Dyp-type peroxidase family
MATAMIPSPPLVGTARRYLALPALARTQGQAPTDSPPEPMLETAQIQGNSLVGFNKDHQAFLYFRITDASVARRWLRTFADQVATMEETLAFRRLFRAIRARRQAESRGLKATWVNVAFTFEGLKKLVSNPAELDDFPGTAFRLGMPSRAGGLGDPVDAAGQPLNWAVGAQDSYPDLVLIVASDAAADLKSKIQRLKREIRELQGISPGRPNKRGLELILEDIGEVLPEPLRGHEHFGFKDGVSQPGVRGLVGAGAADFLTPRQLSSQSPLALSHSAPGQPLIWPGQFVLGPDYPLQNPLDVLQPGLRVPADPAWIRNGSFVVIRRLQQDVAAFWKFMTKTAGQLSANGAAPGITPDRLAAMLMGRWASGTSVVRSPEQDDPTIGQSHWEANHFNFAEPAPRLTTITGDIVPEVIADRDAQRCPFAAHIRKVNPRDEESELGGMAKTLTKRVLRRGIPYGPPIKDRLVDDGVDRGLMFVSYQSSIEDQFEFLSHDWANSPHDPHSFSDATGEREAGQDPVIGQNGSGDRSRKVNVRLGDRFETLTLPREWVIPRGGGYFFSPSIHALREVLGGSP